MSKERDSTVSRLLEEWLNSGLRSVRDMVVQAYIAGQTEAYARGVEDGKRYSRFRARPESFLNCTHGRAWWTCPHCDRGFIAVFKAQEERESKLRKRR